MTRFPPVGVSRSALVRLKARRYPRGFGAVDIIASNKIGVKSAGTRAANNGETGPRIARRRRKDAEVSSRMTAALRQRPLNAVIGIGGAVCEKVGVNINVMKVVALLIISGLYWQLACQVAAVKEPWDAAAYWTIWYPVSLPVSALAGLFFKPRAWWAGLLITFAQLPIMWLNNETGPLVAVGIVFLFVIAIPAIAASAITARIANHAYPR
jgi:hypothetical protein